MSSDLGKVIDVSVGSRSLRHLFTKIRDERTSVADFRKYSSRLMYIVCEEGLAYMDPQPLEVTTPTGAVYSGEKIDETNIVAVSIIRAGDSMLDAFLRVVPEAFVGKILIQRDEETALPVLIYDKLPPLGSKKVVLCDPMLATGGSAISAVEVLVKHGANPRNIYFFNVLSCPEGLAAMASAYPDVQVITGAIDEKLTPKKYISPGLGDYGDRFYGTV